MDTTREERYIEEIKRCMQEGNNAELLETLNEYIGFLREFERFEEGYKISEQILALLKEMGLEGSLSYATSLLNIATLLRAGGRFEDSLSLYKDVETLYDKLLPKDAMLRASFHNNRSLLYQEMGKIKESIDELSKALLIVKDNNADYETAVTYTNLANSYMALSDFENAKKNAYYSKETFEKINELGSHYASALYVLGVLSKKEGKNEEAEGFLKTALSTVEEELGRGTFYERIEEELKEIEPVEKGIDICFEFYKECFEPVIDKEFKDYKSEIAVGLVGRGSDCYGYDDKESRDHDWGPGFLIWVSKETLDKIGDKLEKAYNELPKEYKGFKVARTLSTHKRRGVFVTEDFYKDLLGKWPLSEEDYKIIPDFSLSTAVNGRVFTDPKGVFSSYRDELLKGYPKNVLFLKIAESSAKFSQCAQYNYKRMLKRGDNLTASVMLSDGLKEAMKLAHYLENKYPPHDKWLFRSVKDLNFGSEISTLLLKVHKGEDPDIIGDFFARKLYDLGFISDIDNYLDHHTEELLFKSELISLSVDELADKITRLEFKEFDKVENEGGRASCQDDYFTFEKMRKAQYLSFTKEMLMQYLYDLHRESNLGHNLITEKYGRMMESTAPLEYEKIKDNFPPIDEEKKKIIEAVCAICVSWMEEFANKYPKLSVRARSIHTYEDTEYNTSYETYLRGEISTYSDKMLQLFAGFVAGLLKEERNLSFIIMENTAKLYGYDSLETLNKAYDK